MSTSFFVWMAIASLMVGLGWPNPGAGQASSSTRITDEAARDAAPQADSAASDDSGSEDSDDSSDTRATPTDAA